MILILDLGSEENVMIAREIRALVGTGVAGLRLHVVALCQKAREIRVGEGL